VVLYNQKKNHLTLIGPLGVKTIVLTLKLFFMSNASSIYMIGLLSKISKKYRKSFYKSFQAQLTQIFLELSVKYYKTLKLFGVGFRVHSFMVNKATVLQFKLGYSHFIYYKVPQDIFLTVLKETKLFVTNMCLKKLTQISANIKSLKIPEIYKGKGILYHNEKIILKKGKKVV